MHVGCVRERSFSELGMQMRQNIVCMLTERSACAHVAEAEKTNFVRYSGALLVCTWYIILQSLC